MKIALISMISALCLSAVQVNAQGPGTQPAGIIVMVADDMGWSDAGSYGNTFIDTPSIDRLANNGLKFKNFYAAGPVCSPSRVGLETGRYPVRAGITDHLPGYIWPHARMQSIPNSAAYLDPDMTTLAEVATSQGWSAAQVGKWHLAIPRYWEEGGPDAHGYDRLETPSIIERVFMKLGGPDTFGRWLQNAGLEDVPEPKVYRSDFFTDTALEFLEDNSQDPFFLMVSYLDPHTPIRARESLVQKYRDRAATTGDTRIDPVYAAMVEQLDTGVGRIIDTLETQGILEDTLLIFVSDNGGLIEPLLDKGKEQRNHKPITTNAPLRGQKGTLYEGGVRVPFIAHWPAAIDSGETDAMASMIDILPTVAALTGYQKPLSVDGVDLSALLLSGTPLPPRSLYFHFPHYHHGEPAGALIRGNYKLIEDLATGDVALYDLASDIGETRNLADTRRDLTDELRGELDAWQAEMNLAPLEENQNYVPALAREPTIQHHR